MHQSRAGSEGRERRECSNVTDSIDKPVTSLSSQNEPNQKAREDDTDLEFGNVLDAHPHGKERREQAASGNEEA